MQTVSGSLIETFQLQEDAASHKDGGGGGSVNPSIYSQGFMGPRSLNSSSMELLETEMSMGLYNKPRTCNGLATCLALLCTLLLLTSAVTLTLLILQIHGTVDLAPSLHHHEHQEKKEVPSKMACVKDYEEYASVYMDRDAWTVIQQGATTKNTLRDNEEAFQRYRLMPNYLVGVFGFDSSTTVLGEPVSMPIGISPTAWQKWVYPDGDNATALAAQEEGALHILSVYSSVTIEEVAEAAPQGLRWQQLYLFGLREYTLDIVHRAEAAGSKALVVTIDRPAHGLTYDSKRAEVEWPWDIAWPNFKNQSFEVQRAVSTVNQSWDELAWLKSKTSLPIVLKGMLNADDVQKAADVGVKGILVSNHGGRVLDGVPATIDVLSSIVQAAKDTSIEIYLDSGVRTGMDVFRAMALGARMVFIGRPVLWGLCHSGQEGVESILHRLNKEFVNTAQQCGCPDLASINASMIIKPSTTV